MKYIKLTQKLKAIVDNEDYGFLSQWTWFYGKRGYAVRNLPGKKQGYMHRIINKTPTGLFTDHINGDKLDNRKSNLRTVNKSQNIRNAGKRKFIRRQTATSKFKGVSYLPKQQKWRATASVNYKNIHIGVFKTEKSAALAYKNFIKTNDL